MDQYNELTAFFKVFSDSTRLKILHELLDGDKNVSDICCKIDVSQSAVSHQLRLLREARVVKTRRIGKNIVYTLVDNHIKKILEYAFEHLNE